MPERFSVMWRETLVVLDTTHNQQIRRSSPFSVMDFFNAQRTTLVFASRTDSTNWWFLRVLDPNSRARISASAIIAASVQ